MTIKECYAVIGNYDEVVSRLMNDVLIQRFAFKFLDDPSFSRLTEAYNNEDYPQIFRQAHTLKGVANNLALTQLASAASELTELCRDEQPHDVHALMERVTEEYNRVVDTIRQVG